MSLTSMQRFSFISVWPLENSACLLQWQPSKISDLDKIYIVGRGLLKKHFGKTSVRISEALGDIFTKLCTNIEHNQAMYKHKNHNSTYLFVHNYAP